MAEEKKSFVVYADWNSQFNLLSDDEAGRLIKHIFSYVNDENPEFTKEDRLLMMAFEPIKNQLKRDLKKYETIKQKRSEAGKRSAEAKAIKAEQESTNSTSVKSVQQEPTNSTVNDTDNVTVNGSVNDTVTGNDKKSTKLDSGEETSPTPPKKKLEDRKENFKLKIEPYLSNYPRDMLNDFFGYWTEKNDNGLKMRFEMQKVFDVGRRLATWAKNDNNSFKNGKQTSVSTSQNRQQRIDEVASLRGLAKSIISNGD